MAIRRTAASTSRPSAVPGDAADLLEAVARGDRAAFAQLYDLLAPLVYGLASWILSDPPRAETVAQETFVEVWRTAARYDATQGSALAWIIALSHQIATDRVRSTASPDRQYRMPVPAPEVRECLESLTRIEREAIVYSYYHGHTPTVK